MNRILISNIYSWKNKGDAAIVLSMIQEVKKYFPSSEISLSCFDPNDFGRYGLFRYHSHVGYLLFKKSSSNIFKFFISIWFLLRIIFFKAFFKIFNIKPYFIFSVHLKKKIQSYESFDLVIACGGGYLLTRTNFAILPLMIFTYDFYLANIFKKPYLLYNQSVGPFFNRSHTFLLKNVLKNARVIICREKLSYFRLLSYGLNNLLLSYDIAFNMPLITNKNLLLKYHYDSRKINIGITVRKWLKGEKQRIYEKEIASFIKNTLY